MPAASKLPAEADDCGVDSVNEDGLQPGFVLTSPVRPVRVARQFEAQVGEYRNF